MLRQHLVRHGLCQRIHLRFVELGQLTWNRFARERLLTAFVEVCQLVKDRAAMHAVGKCQVGRLHTDFGCFDGTQAHDFERGMVKLVGVDFM